MLKIRTFAVALLGMSLALIAVAQQDVAVRSDYPDEYVVQQGDTLWDISGRFLEKPWQWPAIWQANPQVDNPHLIYPGDRLRLVWVDGQPRLVSDNRMSPQIREVDAIETIPLEAIEEFLRRPRVMSEAELEDAGYIIANNEQRNYAARGDHTYARNLPNREGDQVIIARLTNIYEDVPNLRGNERLIDRSVPPRWPGAGLPNDVEPAGQVWRAINRLRGDDIVPVGYEVWEVAQAEVVKSGDVSVLRIEGGKVEVRAGDYVLQPDGFAYPRQFAPHAMDNIPGDARVLAISNAVYGVGKYQLAALNIGASDGVEVGHVFSAHRPGEVIRDEVRFPKSQFNFGKGDGPKNVKLPDEYTGELMVFRTFNDVSYGIVLDGDRPVSEFDLLKHPDVRF